MLLIFLQRLVSIPAWNSIIYHNSLRQSTNECISFSRDFLCEIIFNPNFDIYDIY